jgi:hypothetical protein
MDKTDNRFYREAGVFPFSLAPEQVQALYLTLLRRERPAFGWMEAPLVAIEAALKPAHDAIHDRQFNTMNRRFFGDDRFRLDEAAMPTEIAASQPKVLTDEQIARTLWAIRREEEDRCDMELEDMGTDHSVWREAAAISALLESAK